MAGNIEEFIVELGFSDDKAIKGIKDFLGKVDQVNKKVVSRSKRQQEQLAKSAQKNNKATEQGNKLLQEQDRLRNKIIQAQKLGIDTTSEERSLARAKQVNTLTNRRLKLEERISKERLKQNKVKVEPTTKGTQQPKEKDETRQYNRWLESKYKEEQKEQEKTQKAYIDRKKQERKNQNKAAKKVEAEAERAKKTSIKYFNRMSTMFSSASFRQIEQSNPLQAQVFRERRNNIADMAGRISPTDVEGQRKLQRNFEALRHEINMTSDSMRKHTKTMLGVSTVQKGLSDSTRHLIRSYASLFALIEGTTAINRVGQDFQSMEASMLLASGTTQQAAKDLGFVREEALRLGLDLRTATDGFVKLKFAASGKIADDEINQLFVGFNEFARAVGVDRFRTEKGLQAIQQMVNKGQIMAEELKQQLAEQVPGSMKVFEKALGVTSAELFQMMERGELMADEVLPKVGKAFAEMARQGGALEAQIASGRAQQGRFNLVMQEAAKIIFDSGFERGLSDFFKEMVDQTIAARDGLEGLGQVFRWFFNTLTLGSKILMPVLDSVFFVLGNLFGFVNSLSDLFGSKWAGGIFSAVAAIGALSLALGKFKNASGVLSVAGKNAGVLSTAVGGIVRLFSFLPVKILAAVAALDDIFSLFDTGREGLLEKFLFGENLTIDLGKMWSDLLSGRKSAQEVGAELGKEFNKGFFGKALEEEETEDGVSFQDKFNRLESEFGQSFRNAGLTLARFAAFAVNPLDMTGSLVKDIDNLQDDLNKRTNERQRQLWSTSRFDPNNGLLSPYLPLSTPSSAAPTSQEFIFNLHGNINSEEDARNFVEMINVEFEKAKVN